MIVSYDLADLAVIGAPSEHLGVAYVKTDIYEDPEVMADLTGRLGKQGIKVVLTDKLWKDVKHIGPFLYFRNPYIRIDNEAAILRLHKDSNFSRIYCEEEAISIDNNNSGYTFQLKQNIRIYEPKRSPAPILISTSNRATYLELTLNSLIYNNKSPDQKIFIVASDPTEDVREVISSKMKSSSTEINAVVVKNSLLYAGTNFGAKFYNLEKFIIWDDDVIIPPMYDYFVPYWTRQINHRMTTADMVSFRIGDKIYTSDFMKCAAVSPYLLGEYPLPNPLETTWHYHDIQLGRPGDVTNDRRLLAFGTVCNKDRKTLKGYHPPLYYNNEYMNYYMVAKNICMLNIPAYHIGGNKLMDYPEFSKIDHYKKSIDQFQVGTDLRTGVTKIIDMASDWVPQP